MKKVKTIDIEAKEWFDKINGNSYFSGLVTVNYGMDSQTTFIMPFQYGYGDQYLQEAKSILSDSQHIRIKGFGSLYGYCEDNKIILRQRKIENCLKREL